MPTVIWVGLNVWRLTAATFMAWALVAQFLSLADEINAINDAQSMTPAVVNYNTSRITHVSDAAVTQWGSMTKNDGSVFRMANAAQATTALVVATPANSGLLSSTPTRVTAATSAAVIMGGMAPVAVVTTTARALVGIEARELRSGILTVSMGETLSQSSTIQYPQRLDTTGWVALSRLTIAVLLGLLLSAQLGVPESFLYNHLSWIGPQSTPLALGTSQMILAVEILRAPAKPVNLIPAYAVFAVGGVNLILGCTLLVLGRKLPKTPPPPLYFNQAQRLLFWTPPPPFYRGLFESPLPTHLNHPVDKPVDPRDIRHTGRTLPRSNAHEIGLSDSESDGGDSIEKAPAARERRMIQGTKPLTADQDVSRGGYPTFSGTALGAGGRQVPAGMLQVDRHGVPTGLIQTEEGVETMLDNASSLSSRSEPDGTRSRAVRGSRKGSDHQKPRLPAIATGHHLDISVSALGHSHPSDIQGGREARNNDPSQAEAISREDVSRPNLHRVKSTASENSAYGGISSSSNSHGSRQKQKYRKSIDQAAKDFGPHFPLPPGHDGGPQRSVTIPAVSSLPTKSPAVGPDGRTIPSPYLARGPSLPTELMRSAAQPSSQYRLPPKRTASTSTLALIERGSSAIAQHAPDVPKLPKTPRTPKTPKTPLMTPSPITPAQIAHAQHGQRVSGHVYERQVTASPELLSDTEVASHEHRPPRRARSQSVSSSGSASSGEPMSSSLKRASSARSSSNRPPLAVRFDLTPVREDSEGGTPTPPATGLKIPGINLTIPLPAILSPVSRRNSFASIRSVESALIKGRPASTASITSMMQKLQDDMKKDQRQSSPVIADRNHKEETKRKRESNVFGGEYWNDAGGNTIP